MRGLRYLLIVKSIVTAGFIAYSAAKERFNVPWFVVAWFLACVLNAGYLAWAGVPNDKPQKSRILRLFQLWLDAKESELEARIHPRSKIDE
jgi:hypothetical protein